ncbi:MAG: hypothetical protein ABSE84_13770, partial [Isosphaeraceae bacterium]
MDQGRFKSFQAQGNERFLTATACRDVERNALRANLVERTRRGGRHCGVMRRGGRLSWLRRRGPIEVSYRGLATAPRMSRHSGAWSMNARAE